MKHNFSNLEIIEVFSMTIFCTISRISKKNHSEISPYQPLGWLLLKKKKRKENNKC